MNTNDSGGTIFHSFMAKNASIEIDPNEKGLSQAQAFIGEMLDRRHVNATIVAETMLLFEAVFHAVVSGIGDGDAKIEVNNVVEL